MTIGEVWALPTMLRFGLISCLSRALADDLQLSWPDSAAWRDLIQLSDDLTAQDVIAHAVQSLRAQPPGLGRLFRGRQSGRADASRRSGLRRHGLRATAIARSCRNWLRTADKASVRWLAVDLAQAETVAAASSRRAHVGYFLIDRGRPALETALGYRAPLLPRLGWPCLRGHPTALYLGTIGTVAVLFLIGVGVCGAERRVAGCRWCSCWHSSRS
ncbi:MAG: hypothetical protein R2851_03605 [Caldilineaceae bacterium]